MDAKQVWYGYYLTPEKVSEFFKRQDESAFQCTKVHELFITWVVAQFLQSQKKSPHLIGFPSLEKRKGLTLSDLLTEQILINDDNFDTVIADVANIDTPIRLQIKRYTRIENATTKDFSRFLIKKVQRYGNAPELSVIFHIRQTMKLNLPQLAKYIATEELGVGCILVFIETQLRQRCILFELYPNYTGVMWSPSK